MSYIKKWNNHSLNLTIEMLDLIETNDKTIKFTCVYNYKTYEKACLLSELKTQFSCLENTRLLFEVLGSEPQVLYCNEDTIALSWFLGTTHGVFNNKRYLRIPINKK